MRQISFYQPTSLSSLFISIFIFTLLQFLCSFFMVYNQLLINYLIFINIANVYIIINQNEENYH